MRKIKKKNELMDKFDILEDSFEIGDRYIYRLHYKVYYYDGSGKEVSDWLFRPFYLPNDMKREDGFKVLSYLLTFIVSNPNVNGFSLEAVRLLNQTLDLEKFGFSRVYEEKPNKDDIVDLFVLDGFLTEVKLSGYYPNRYFEWYIPNVSRNEIVDIYDELGMEFSDLIWSDYQNGKILKDTDREKVVENKELEDFGCRDIIEGEYVGVNPLVEVPQVKVKLYSFDGITGDLFFGTEKEMEYFAKGINLNDILIIQYLGSMALRNDVIRVINMNGEIKYYSMVDSLGYAVYNEERSIYTGKFVWEYQYGSLRNVYQEFKKRGIVLENDVYQQEDDSEKAWINPIGQKRLTREKIDN